MRYKEALTSYEPTHPDGATLEIDCSLADGMERGGLVLAVSVPADYPCVRPSVVPVDRQGALPREWLPQLSNCVDAALDSAANAGGPAVFFAAERTITMFRQLRDSHLAASYAANSGNKCAAKGEHDRCASNTAMVAKERAGTPPTAMVVASESVVDPSADDSLDRAKLPVATVDRRPSLSQASCISAILSMPQGCVSASQEDAPGFVSKPFGSVSLETAASTMLQESQASHISSSSTCDVDNLFSDSDYDSDSDSDTSSCEDFHHDMKTVARLINANVCCHLVQEGKHGAGDVPSGVSGSSCSRSKGHGCSRLAS